MLKRGRSRTPGNYCTVVRQMPIMAGYPTTDALRYELNAGKRSAMRGIGPTHHSSELPLERLHELEYLEVPVDDYTPIGLVDLFVLPSFFSLREVEAPPCFCLRQSL